MQDFRKSNKISNVLWIKSSANRLNLRIKIKPREGAVKLPTYSNETTAVELENDTSESYIFKWREKVFSRWEYQHYSEINNCVLDFEKEYNKKIQNTDYKVSQMFTYLETDKAISMPILKDNEIKNQQPSLIERVYERMTNDITSSTRHLFKSESDLSNDEHWQAMHIVWDSSEYNDDNQLLFKDEVVLLSLYYNPVNGSLLVSPRENDISYNPYGVFTSSGALGFQYGVEVLEEEDDDEELVALLHKLDCKLERTQKSILRFLTPPRGRTAAVVRVELLAAGGCERDDVYVEYTVRVPDEIQCTGELHGRTHVSKMSKDSSGTRRWNFGHEVLLELEYDQDIDPPPLTIYFEAISVDWWRRHRTEGYAYVKLVIQPGECQETLTCRRPEELNRIEAERRRFFVGECHLIKDLRVLDHPQDYDATFRYITSGDITVRWSIITQAHHPLTLSSGHSSASRLLRGAEDALQQYSRAKATLASATEDLDAIYGSGDRE